MKTTLAWATDLTGGYSHEFLPEAETFARSGFHLDNPSVGAALSRFRPDAVILHGYGSKFGHSTGHGLGIEVHELPALNQRGERYKLEPNQVVTIEPGIYIEGIGGVRIEDDVVIRKDGCEVLTCSPKELRVL